jgi:serine phosphatase RsbU (regulator of sigma subunit)
MSALPARVSDWLVHLVTAQRAVAHVVIDGEQRVTGTGGDLSNYGLAGLVDREPASVQLPFLEGLLPLPETPFLIPSMEMPNGRVADVHLLAEADATWLVLLDVTAEHGEARKVQQKAYDVTLLNQREARLHAKLEAAHRELTAAHRELTESRAALLVTHNRLEQELREAERYVRAILPAPIVEQFAVDWRYVPSTELGGDSLGYHWIDADHFAVYLLDVCGHGVGSALLSVAAVNTLRTGALSGTDFRQPGEVLSTLNQAYQMESHNDLYFTIWYGVYEPSARRLRYASAGHPSPILVRGERGEGGVTAALRAKGPVLGVMPGVRYRGEECVLDAPASLYVFSDGVYEVTKPDGQMLEFATFEEALARQAPDGSSKLDALLAFAREAHGATTLEDDFSIIEITI